MRILGRCAAADLMLDTMPYGAHTTGSDALWAGVPLVTVMGPSFANRVAASLVTAMGAPELIAASLEDYEALALALARDPARLAALKAKTGRQSPHPRCCSTRRALSAATSKPPMSR